MQTTNIKKKWDAGFPTVNGWCSIGSTVTAEIMAAQGYDSLTIDMQHGALDYSAALPMLQTMRASGATLLVRVPWRDAASTMKALDAGAMGVICPMINNRAEAEEFVSYTRYPPDGQRSFGPTRASVAMPGYGIDANNHVLALAMIETADGMRNLEDIASTPGLDGIYVGPADLTLGTQKGRLQPGLDREEAEMISLIKQVAEVCRQHNIAAGIHCGSAAYAARAISWGYKMTTVSGDARLLASAASNTVSEWRNLTKQEREINENASLY